MCSQNTFWGTVETIGSGIGQAGQGFWEALGNEDLQRGVEFGVGAAGVVMKETAKIVAQDVALAAANYIPLPPGVGFVTGRGLSGLAISRNFYGLEEVANRVSRDIVIIRNDVFPY